MVKKHFCDKCGKEINDISDDFDDMFNGVTSDFKNESRIIQPQLCNKCGKGYKKIIKEVNKKIKDYLKIKKY